MGSVPVSEIDFETRRGILLGAAMRFEENLDNVMRESSQDFFSQPDYQEQVAQIRQSSAKKPMPAPRSYSYIS